MQSRFLSHSTEHVFPLINDSQVIRETTYDGITYICPTWDQMGEYTFSLAQQILESGQSFEGVVALAKGGWTWARTLVDYVDIENLYSIRIKSYTGINAAEEPTIVQPLYEDITGMNILILDEVVDSGKTIKKAKENLLKEHKAGNVQVATLCYKPCSEIEADFYAFTTEGWVVFPHEIREFITQATKQWRSDNLTDQHIVQRLQTIGISYHQIVYFMNLI